MPAPDAAGDDAGQIIDRDRPENVHAPVGKAAEQHWDQTGADNRQEQVNHRLSTRPETPILHVEPRFRSFLLIDVFARGSMRVTWSAQFIVNSANALPSFGRTTFCQRGTGSLGFRSEAEG